MNANPIKKNTDEPLVINIEGAKRRKCLINGDPNKVLYLNLTDLGIFERLQKCYPELEKLSDRVDQLQKDLGTLDENDVISEHNKKVANELRECDAEMRKLIDTIFDANVSEVCDEGGTMYDVLPQSGQQRYDNIVSCLIQAFGADLDTAYNSMQKKRDTHTNKYTKKK